MLRFFAVFIITAFTNQVFCLEIKPNPRWIDLQAHRNAIKRSKKVLLTQITLPSRSLCTIYDSLGQKRFGGIFSQPTTYYFEHLDPIPDGGITINVSRQYICCPCFIYLYRHYKITPTSIIDLIRNSSCSFNNAHQGGGIALDATDDTHHFIVGSYLSKNAYEEQDKRVPEYYFPFRFIERSYWEQRKSI